MREPSILDYVKSLFDPEITIDIHDYFHKKSEKNIQPHKLSKNYLEGGRGNANIILGTGLALLAQAFLEPTRLFVELALILYFGAFLLIWKGMKQQPFSSRLRNDSSEYRSQFEIKYFFLILSFLFQLASFSLFSGNQFNGINIVVWIMGMVFLAAAVWQPQTHIKKQPKKKDLLFILLLVISCFIIVFFRIFQITEVPSEMFSDQAEKLLDVMDVLRGDFPVFFIRNTGREAIQFYITAIIIKTFGTDINFLSLKIGTVLFGFVTLPFIFLIGKDQSNKWGGLIAMLFAGIGYWPNVISRVGLRYSLYPLFTAPILYFLIRGLRERNRNYLLKCGLLLGLGLHGYSSFRILPFLVVIIFFLYLSNR